MPYIMMDEVPEGYEEADVVERSLYDAVIEERDSVVTQRDSAVEQLAVTRRDLEEQRSKYAAAVIGSAAKAKASNASDVKRDSRPQTFKELFTRREGN